MLNPLINKIHRTVRLTLLNNTHGVISDCHNAKNTAGLALAT